MLARFYMQTALHGVEIPSSVRMRSIGFGAPIVFAHPSAELPEEAARVMAALDRDTLTFVNGKVWQGEGGERREEEDREEEDREEERETIGLHQRS